MNLRICDRLRLQTIDRWHMAVVHPKQTVASHSYSVAMIARYILQKGGYNRHVQVAALELALDHDVIECLTGDIPSPAKLYLKDIGIDINKEFDKLTKLPKIDIKTATGFSVKAADKIDTLTYLQSYGVGPISHRLSTRLHSQLSRWFAEMSDTRYVMEEIAELAEVAREVWIEISEGQVTFL